MNTLPKKMLFITYCFPPNSESGVHRSLRFIRYIQKFGWEVVVLTVDPSSYLYETPEDNGLLQKIPPNIKIIRTSVIRGWDKLIRLRNRVKRSLQNNDQYKEKTNFSSLKIERGKKGFIQRIKDALTVPFSIPDDHAGWVWSGIIKGYREVKGNTFDVIYSSGPPWTAHLIGMGISKLGNIPWVADFRDPWARNPWKSNRKWIQQKLANICEARVVKNADYIILNTQLAMEEYKNHYKNLKQDRFKMIPNGFDPEDFEGIKMEESSPTNGCFHLVHTGALYGGRDPEPVLKGISIFIQKHHLGKGEFKFSLVGVEEKQMENIMRCLVDLNLQDVVQLEKRVSHREALSKMAQADVLVILQGGTHLCIPAKLYEYMAFGKPILGFAPEGATADLIRNYPKGKVLGSENSSQIAGMIELFFDEWKNPSAKRYMKENWSPEIYCARRLTENLNEILKQAMRKK